MALTEKQLTAVGAILAVNFLEIEEREGKNHKRKYWVKPFLAKRLKYDVESVLLKDLLMGDHKDYKNFLRMTHEEFEEVHEKIRDCITKNDTSCRAAISSEVKLGITLRYLATGDSYRSLQFLSRISPAAISIFIPIVCKAIYNSMVKNYMLFTQSTDDWLQISKDFEDFWQFPHTLGALDGKHICIKKPSNEGSMFYNYKGFHSVVLLALVDAHCRFLFIDVGCNGRASDGGIFRNSYLYESMKTKSANIPENENLPMTNEKTSYFIIADDAFPLDLHLMKPYARKGILTEEQRIFNYRICRARMVVEAAFGRLAGRFRIFHKPIEINVDSLDWVIKATCVLHNYLTKETKTKGIIYEPQIENIPETITNISKQTTHGAYKFACRIRDSLAHYFVTSGNVSFQWNKI